jgi:hypothetical protein
MNPRQLQEWAARRAEAAWPLAYVDRPQTMFRNMDSWFVTARDYFGGPPGYRRHTGTVGYAKAFSDELEFALSLPSLYCSGAGDGGCGGTLRPQLTFITAVLTDPRARLDFGLLLYNIHDSADLWTRLKLVKPHRFSLEIEPRVSVGIAERPIISWWDRLSMQDGNQSRASLTLDANLQLGDHVLLWADAIPYAPLARLGHPSDTALQIAAGVGLAVSKRFEVNTSCRAFNVLAARRWEYVPDVRVCTLTLLTRGFGEPSNVTVSTVPVPDDAY